MSLTTGLRRLPFEVYPLVFMMSCALGFGGYVVNKKLSFDPDLRIRPNHGAIDWTERVGQLPHN
ncbi:hypothetical protein BC831DRAFT_401966 [Entophlyctis helioformis]|nr:hypothetical protein BC831DRAFT_401925 [Entophlyctis helioformis]KAI8924817.1 hypothetical protein BC831DRAFT_401966 [Entophlyctis helioformis]